MKILIVEDNKDTAGALKECLEAESFAVDYAKDGEQGSLYGKNQPIRPYSHRH